MLYDVRMGVKFTLKRKTGESLPNTVEVMSQKNVLEEAKIALVLPYEKGPLLLRMLGNGNINK